MKFFGVEFAPLLIPLQRRLQTVGALVYATWFLFLGFGSFLFGCYLLFFTRYYIIPLLYLAWFAYDRDICNRGGRPFPWVKGWRVWRYMRDYFPISMVKTVELDPAKNYIFGYHPHGIMCAGAFCNFATTATNFNEVYPNIKPHLLTLEGQFWFPIHREIFLGSGACAASKSSIEWLLTREGKGNALVLVIGGAVEALDARPGTVCLTLQRRKGFIKLALKHGASLVPVFSFGENDLFAQVTNPEGSLLKRVQTRLTKFLGFSVPLFRGRGIFQYNIGYLPYRKPIITVVGSPIDVEVNHNPSDKDVEDLHAKYIGSLEKLFEDHKEKYGYGKQILKIK